VEGLPAVQTPGESGLGVEDVFENRGWVHYTEVGDFTLGFIGIGHLFPRHIGRKAVLSSGG
jgi:hypothetical protein